MQTLDDYARLTVSDVCRVLTEASGRRITAAMLRADLAAGAPTNPDGTINLIHYAAWLLAQRRAKWRH